VKEVFYRVAQEALNNIAKHAGASQVQVHLIVHDGDAEVIIQDDGCGFDLVAMTPEHMGLKFMRERADAVHAKLNIVSAPGAGTLIQMRWHTGEMNN
jgi:signal transduction histidine kinase